MDIPLAVARLIPEALYSMADTYAHLVETWYDPRPIPTEAALEAAWGEIVIERQQEIANAAADAAKQLDAKTGAHNIPNWATWTEAQALAWFDARLSDAQIDAVIDPAANLAQAKAAIKTVMKDQGTALRALVRMVVALRDEAWPDLDRFTPE